MRRVWVVVLKEWREALKGGKLLWVGTVALPVILLGISVYMMLSVGDLSALEDEDLKMVLHTLFSVFLLYFMLFPMIIPNAISVYAIMSEKEQKSLEPLLATPLQTWELFLAKVLSAVIPAVVITWATFGVFVLIVGQMLPAGLWEIVWRDFGIAALVTLVLFAPLASVFVTMTSMAIATRTSDARSAQLLSSFVVLPIALWALVSIYQNALLQPANLVGVSLLLLGLNIVLLKIAVRLFRREEILTRWR
ncbi:MAG: ABC transporter permease subunit [Candidatus Bipolaricaulota bacterium]|nr:ABC transporter permease subunit [Candidatus Bipolaricaulota bacterium]MCS7275325.1 ABC transporter permease subunit [Candidatus Bipolaricaulota bacterium]MDW8110176.1 ABC transporter permease subunit [Candidatus Bipolaricaulota bacterium]